MGSLPLVFSMAALLLLLPVLVVASPDVVGGRSAYCSQQATGKCDVQAASVVLQEPGAIETVVSYEQLKAMLSSHNVQLLDVRNPDEFQAGYIPDATNVPLAELEEALQLTPELFRKRYHVNAPMKADEDIVFYCQRGRRSATALEIAYNLGFIWARHYAGGYSEWEQRECQ